MTDSNTGALRATINAAALCDGLKRLARCTKGEGPAVPILSGVMLQGDAAAGVLRLICTNLDSQAVATIPAHIECEGAAVPLLAPIAAIMGKLPAGAQVELNAHPSPSRGQSGAASPAAALGMIAGRFRASLNGFLADDFPMIAQRAAAFSFAMPARPLLAILAAAATDAKPAGGGDSEGAQFTFAHDGLGVTAGARKSMMRRRYPLPRMIANGLGFRPMPDSPIVATFSAESIRALADAIEKPGAKDGDGPAVTIGFAVEAGAVVAAMVEAGGLVVTVKAGHNGAHGHGFPAFAAMDSAPRVEWFRANGDALALALESMSKGDGVKRDGFKVEWREESDGNWLAVANDGGASAIVEGYACASFAACEPVGLPLLLSKPVKGAGLVTVYQVAGDWTGRGVLAVDLPGGATCYLSGFAEAPAVRFARTYGAAYAARDGAGIAAAVAAYRAVKAGADDVAVRAAIVRDMRPSMAARAKAGELTKAGRAGTFAPDPKRYKWQSDESFTALVNTLSERNAAAEKAAAWEAERERERAADNERGYSFRLSHKRPAGKIFMVPAADDVGHWTANGTRAAFLADACGAKYDGARGYVLTPAQAERFESLFAAGFEGVGGSRTITHPDGLAVPKVTRAKRAAAADDAAPVAVEPHSGVLSVESSDAPQTVAEAPVATEAPATLEMAAFPDAMPDATPFIVPDALKTSQFDKPAADDAPDLAALVASLVARIEALESERAAPVDNVAVPVAVDNAAVLAAEARADDLAAQLAAMTRDRDDWRAIAEQNHAGLVEARADLAEMTAVRDRHREARNAADDANKALRRRRYRTAAAIRKVRGRADLDKRALAATVESVAQWRDDLDNARVALAAVTARAERAESELRRRTVLDPLAGLRYAGGNAALTR